MIVFFKSQYRYFKEQLITLKSYTEAALGIFILTMILKLKPSIKNYIWGGTNLRNKWNKASSESKIAETWELSLNNSGMCYVCGGEHNGKLLADVLQPCDIGNNSHGFPFFPTLVKMIDSAAPLSLQVHPDDAYALQREHKYGKTEMWHIIDATDDAYIYLGFNCDVTKEQFIDALKNKTLCSLLNRIAVKANQTYFVPSGTIHAIGSGVTLIEIQQNSDLTYRIYDYDRLDANGRLRDLHIDKAMDVLNFNKYLVPDPNRNELLGKCKYFAAYRYQGERILFNPNSFMSVTVLDGEIFVGSIGLKRGESAFISAGTKAEIIGSGCYCLVTVEDQI